VSQQRSISRVLNVPPAAPGFVGPGHLAAPAVSPENFDMNDPFILLMDDHLDIGGSENTGWLGGHRTKPPLGIDSDSQV